MNKETDIKENSDISPELLSFREKLNSFASIEDLEELSSELISLRKELQENPNLCELLYPEDLGQLVMQLRRIYSVVAEKKVKRSSSRKKSAQIRADIAADLKDIVI